MRNEAAVAEAALKRAEVFDKSTALMHKYTGTSASDCGIKMDRNVDNCPGTALGEIAQMLMVMNFNCIEKKAHRQALARAGRTALARLALTPSDASPTS